MASDVSIAQFCFLELSTTCAWAVVLQQDLINGIVSNEYCYWRSHILVIELAG